MIKYVIMFSYYDIYYILNYVQKNLLYLYF